MAGVWFRLKKNKLAVVSLFVILALILIAIFAPLLAPYKYDEMHSADAFSPSCKQYLLGTDKLGRDILSRLIYGARQSLTLGLVSILFAAGLGIIFGAIAGYFGGWVDNLFMRFLDIYQSIPMLLLCITLSAILGPSLKNAIIAISISMMPQFARLMRASILTVRESEYIEAAKSVNSSNLRIIVRDILPNAISPLIVTITMQIGGCILVGSMLSFIGLGVQPPNPEWGTMISDARDYLRSHVTLALYPGLCIMITVIAFNLLGDGLRDALDPRLKD